MSISVAWLCAFFLVAMTVTTSSSRSLAASEKGRRLMESLRMTQPSNRLGLLSKLRVERHAGNPLLTKDQTSTPKLTFRSKRQATSEGDCSMTDGGSFPDKSQADWKSVLGNNTFLGLNPPMQEESHDVDEETNLSCQNAAETWWPGNKDSLRAECPWTVKMEDLGADHFPRYVENATCICTQCMTDQFNVSQCMPVYGTTTVFQKTGCRDGLAVLEKKEELVVLGCYCRSPRLQGGGAASGGTPSPKVPGDITPSP